MLVCTGVPAAELYPPPAGTDRQSAAYLDATERYLGALDLDGAELAFHRLGGTTASNWSVSRAGQKIGDLKCTEGNTNHRGAVVAYRLGRELGFNIYPVAVYRDVDRDIAGRPVKEQCALKEWASALTQYYWTRDTFVSTDSADKRRLVAALRCDEPAPKPDDRFQYYARSAYGDPKIDGLARVPYSGLATLADAARDFSNMMVVDLLIGNEDRFPGGNVFFRSITNSYDIDEGGVDFENARLFSLDNEAAFKGRGPASTHAARDLAKFVWRFDPEMIQKLREIAADSARLGRITDDDPALVEFIRTGIELVLKQHAAAVSKCGREMAEF